MDDIEKLWISYRLTKDQTIRDKFIIHYSGLVKIVAGRLNLHIGQHVEFEDLVSYGIFGLIDAIDKFDYDKGVKFETYASLRIRGSIIDSIRKMDWVPRTLRQKNKLLETAYINFELNNGREPTDEELSEILGISLKETKDLVKKSAISSLISLDDYLDQNYEISYSQSNEEVETPEKQHDLKEIKILLSEGISKLSENEKKVIGFYYFEELTLKEISYIMGVSESRVSQIHSKALLKLNSKLGKYKSILYWT